MGLAITRCALRAQAALLSSAHHLGFCRYTLSCRYHLTLGRSQQCWSNACMHAGWGNSFRARPPPASGLCTFCSGPQPQAHAAVLCASVLCNLAGLNVPALPAADQPKHGYTRTQGKERTAESWPLDPLGWTHYFGTRHSTPRRSRRMCDPHVCDSVGAMARITGLSSAGSLTACAGCALVAVMKHLMRSVSFLLSRVCCQPNDALTMSNYDMSYA
jgi:hypothetical protein